jgi:hypothetical protein
MASKLVERAEIGKIFSLIAFAQFIMPIFAAPAMTSVFNATLDIDPGIAFYGISAVNLPALTLCLYLDLLQRRMPGQTSTLGHES